MIELTVMIAFVVMFIHASTWEGMINEWVATNTQHWPSWIKKPLYDCPICMCPWWGSLILTTYGLTSGTWLNWLEWIMVVFAAGGINTVLIYIISSDKEIYKELKDDQDTGIVDK